jgi:hypothetical protein
MVAQLEFSHSALRRSSFSHSTQQGSSEAQRYTTYTQENFKQTYHTIADYDEQLTIMSFKMQRLLCGAFCFNKVVIQPLNPARSIKISKRHDIHTGKIQESII